MKKNLFFCLSFCAAVLLAPAVVFAQSDLQAVATVQLTKTEAISVKQLKKEVENLEKSAGRKLSAEERREVLNSMINQRLALQAADRDKINISDSEVNQQLTELRGQLTQQLGRAPSDAEFADAVKKETGMDLPSFRDQYKKQLTVQKYLMEKKRDVLQSAKPPSEDEIKKFYSKNSSEFVQPETVDVSMISIPWKKTSEKSSARSDANKIFKEIGDSARAFDEKVVEGERVNSNTVYKSIKSQLIPRNAQQLPDDFLDAVFALEQGKVSQVLEIDNEAVKGFFIVKVTRNYPQKLLGLDDVMLTPPEMQAQLRGRSLTVRMYIQQGLAMQKQQEVLVKAQEELISDLRKGNPFTINEQFLNY